MSAMANIGRHGLMEMDDGLLWETKDGPGGRVSLGSSGIKVRMTLAGEVVVEAWARTRLGSEHTGFSATGESFHGRSWTG